MGVCAPFLSQKVGQSYFFANSDVAFQDLKPTPLVSVVMGLGSTVQLRQILGHNVTLNNVLSWASFVVTV